MVWCLPVDSFSTAVTKDAASWVLDKQAPSWERVQGQRLIALPTWWKQILACAFFSCTHLPGLFCNPSVHHSGFMTTPEDTKKKRRDSGHGHLTGCVEECSLYGERAENLHLCSPSSGLHFSDTFRSLLGSEAQKGSALAVVGQWVNGCLIPTVGRAMGKCVQ